MDTSDEWARAEFGHAALGNALRTKRLVMVAATASTTPAGTLTEAFRDLGEREGAFRFVENAAVEEGALKHAAHEAGAKRCAHFDFAYVPIDKTSLSLPGRLEKSSFGMVGTTKVPGNGMVVMSALAVSPDGTPQGLVAQDYWTRPAKPKATAYERRRLPPSEKETQYWLDAMTTSAEHFASQASTTRPWFQIDREGDATAILTLAVENEWWLTVRAVHDRRVGIDDDQRDYLWRTMSQQPVMGRYTVAVNATQHRAQRDAIMEVRATQLDLLMPRLGSRNDKNRRRFGVHVVLAREEGTTPTNEEPLEWMLITTRVVNGFDDACEVLFGYTQRWRIEEFHKIWKSGACRVEESQLREPDHLVRWAIILASVAVRLLRMSYVSRTSPERPAETEFSPTEIKAVLALKKPKRIPTSLTVGDVVLWIALLGGYTSASTSGGPPGALVLARGYLDVRIAVRTIEALAET